MNMKDLKKKTTIQEIYAKKLGLPNIVNVLAEAPQSSLTPILLEAAKERINKITPSRLLDIYDSNPDFFGISTLDQREIIKFKAGFYSVLPEKFEAVELAPICPLGTNAILTKISQNNTLSTIRGSEVVSDSTTPLAMACAARRKRLKRDPETQNDIVRLATSHRVLRLQPFDKAKGYMQHFNLLGLCTGGRESRNKTYVPNVMKEHIMVWLDFFNWLNKKGYALEDICVNISNMKIVERIIEGLSLSREVINRNSLNEDFDLFKHFGINLEDKISSIDEINHDKAAQYCITEFLPQLLHFEDKILGLLSVKYPNVKFSFELGRKAGLGYYKDYCFHIYATNQAGRVIQLADGGSVDWVAQLLSDRKEYAVISGIGAELIQKLLFVNEA